MYKGGMAGRKGRFHKSECVRKPLFHKSESVEIRPFLKSESVNSSSASRNVRHMVFDGSHQRTSIFRGRMCSDTTSRQQVQGPHRPAAHPLHQGHQGERRHSLHAPVHGRPAMTRGDVRPLCVSKMQLLNTTPDPRRSWECRFGKTRRLRHQFSYHRDILVRFKYTIV